MTNAETDAKVQELVARYYEDAIRIAHAYKTIHVPEDERETIAINSLYKAAKIFDPEHCGWSDKKSKFNTYLYHLINNAISDAVRKAERLHHNNPVTSMSEYPLDDWGDTDDDDHTGRTSKGTPVYLANISERRMTKRFNFSDMMLMLRPCLNRRQWLIVNYLFYPERLQQKYLKYKFSAPPKRITPTIVANALQISRQQVNMELKRIRIATERILQQIETGHPNTRGLSNVE